MQPNSRLRPIDSARAYRRNLPHWEQPGCVYFLTFHTAPGYPLPDAAKEIAMTAARFHAGKKYVLYACVVMDTHVHMVLQPLETSPGVFHSLASITHSIKSYSANQIQRATRKKGSIWQDESNDRVIRNETELLNTLAYVVGNPVTTGLVTKPEEYRWLFCESWQ